MFGAPLCQASSLRPAASLLIFLLAVTLVPASGAGANVDDLECYKDNSCEGCSGDNADQCHGLASCDQEPGNVGNESFHCECFPDIWDDSDNGDGTSCTSEAAVVRTTFKIGQSWDPYLYDSGSQFWTRLNTTAYTAVVTDFTTHFIDIMTTQPTRWKFSYRITGEGAEKWMSIGVLVDDLDDAEGLLAAWATVNQTANMLTRSLKVEHGVSIFGIVLRQDADLSLNKRDAGSFNPDEIDGVQCDNNAFVLPNGYMPVEPRAYTWTAGTTEDPVFVLPVGMDVMSVDFKHDCLSAGCWVVEVDYTIGEKNFNVFYVPRSDNSDTLSYDIDYADTTLDETFQPANHPCSLDNYQNLDSAGIETTVSACCLRDFVNHYRVMRSFAFDPRPEGCELNGYTAWDYTKMMDQCWDEGKFAKNTGAGVYEHTDPPVIERATMPPSALTGKFSNWNTTEDMQYSHVAQMGVIDPYLGIYKATFYLDEIELRRYMGKLSGTVSVEHTVEFFVGLVDFKPNGLQSGFLDMQAKQVNIVVEKTDFFTVATHGENDYTFLRYTNMRLVEVYVQDVDNTDDAATDRFVRTNRDDRAQFVQVTFTLGDQYGKKEGYDVIPLDSVRVSRGEFLAESSMRHACLDYLGRKSPNDAAAELQFDGVERDMANALPSAAGMDENSTTREKFDYVVQEQDCAPTSRMCMNPSGQDALQDQFVAFNIPVGFNYFPAPQQDLSANIFVHLVVQVENRQAMLGVDAPADQASASNITKTTLSASIPVVAGGINIFCDGITAKTDLQDVAYTKIYVGSAESESELTRLRIIGGPDSKVLTTSVLNPGNVAPAKVDSDSIESGLMTLVLVGNSSYFTSTNGMGLVVEDMFTLHIMEDEEYAMSNGCENAWLCSTGTFKSLGHRVYKLLTSPGEELYDDNNQLQTDGYPLNGAFALRIDRINGRARLETTAGLDKSKGGEANAPCAFAQSSAGTQNPAGDFPARCIIRRDVDEREPNEWVTEVPDCKTNTATGLVDTSDNCDTSVKPWSCPTCDTPEDFFVKIFGNNIMATGLAVDYAKLIRKAEQLNGMYRRAWFINPGYEWVIEASQSRFTLSQKIVLFALIGLDENRGQQFEVSQVSQQARRRFTFMSKSAAGGRRAEGLTENNRAAQFDAVETQNSPERVLATLSDGKVLFENVKKFDIKMLLTTEDECKSEDEIRQKSRTLLKSYFKAFASDVHELYVLNALVERDSSVQCSNRRKLTRKLLAYSDSSVTITAIVGFTTASPKMNREEFEKLPDVVGVSQASSSTAPRIEIDNEMSVGDPAKDGARGSDNEDDDSESSLNVGLIAGVVGGVVGAGILGAIGFFVMKSKRTDPAMTKADLVPSAAQSDIENLKAQLQADT